MPPNDTVRLRHMLDADDRVSEVTLVVGMRNRLIHVYFQIDLDRVCDTVSNDLPPLIANLSGILSD